MTGRTHTYQVTLEWTGHIAADAPDAYPRRRAHTINAGAKPQIVGSSDPAFKGDPSCWNPEDLLVAAVSGCHKLWYMHLCATAGITVTAYIDRAEGVMVEEPSGSGRFTSVTLRPEIRVRAGDDIALAEQLHHKAHANCFIANSVNFPIACEPTIVADG